MGPFAGVWILLIYVVAALILALGGFRRRAGRGRLRADRNANAIPVQMRRDLPLARLPVLLLGLLLAGCAGGPSDAPAPRAPAEAAPAPSGALWNGPGAESGFGTPASPETGAPIRIALLLPLTGPRAGAGQDILLAAEMALFDFADPKLVLMPLDTRGSRDGAAMAARQALDQGVDIVLGPLFSEEVAAAAGVTRGSGRPMIAFSSDSKVAGNGVYLLSFSPEQEVQRIVSFAVSRGYRRFAALLPRSAYGDRVAEAFKNATAGVEGVTNRLVYYYPDSATLDAPVRELTDQDARRQALAADIARLEQSPDSADQQRLAELRARSLLGEVDFETLLIASSGGHLRALGPLLRRYGVDPEKVRYLGTGLWDDPATIAEASLMGGWFPASQPAVGSQLATRMQADFNVRLTPVTSLGYDAVALVATLAAGAEDPAAQFSDEALTNPAGFAGVTGIFRLRPGGLTERALAVMEIQPQGATVIDPAPASFLPPLVH
ncbi:MAG TPA: penicillin-binding protein activator [Alphaproteobacteria bacterium]|nr:penicillin-binding protein activator [Alphaproteobacteria bacterium]